jgi:class 3 adenylate cyclase/CHASE2 domain-containing sensor protein
VKFKPVKLAPAIIAVGIILLFCLLRVFHLGFFERLEKITYDWRVRQSARFPTETATNLAFVYIDDASIAFVKNNHGPQQLGYRYDLPWPRQVYGRLVEELAAEHAKAVGLDVIFAERRHDLAFVQMADGSNIDSDDFFAMQMGRAKNVVLAITKEVRPPPIFATNALALGDISTEKDPDGVLRMACAFRTNHVWHFAFQKLADDPDYGVDLNRARVEADRVVLPRTDADDIVIPLDKDGNFDPTALWSNLPQNLAAKAKPCTEERVWHMGIVLAAQELKLDLSHPEIDLPHGRIVLRGPNGIQRVIPVDKKGFFYVDWSMKLHDPHLTQEPILNVLRQDRMRLTGQTNDLVDKFAGKVVIVGSTASGNDLRDEGATPLESDTYLVSKHWNVANSVITGRFIHRSSLAVDLLILIGTGIITALLVWNLPVRRGLGALLLFAAAYLAAATLIYIHYRYWMPIAMPFAGTFAIMFAMQTTWRVVFEQAEQRRVKSVFSRMVSANVMQEVLATENLALGGARREITVMFADVRGFTEFTDKSQDKAAAYIAENKLSEEAAEDYYDEQARETLNTVNTYLALVADQVKKHDGTLDKYIGDCVMAFWGAPTVMEKQALCCVRASIDAQRAVFELNKQRVQENQKREVENMRRATAGQTPLPSLPILLLGSGINTGMATAGLMGSQEDRFNYTVFGREVNMASRLETLSGRGRIIISETTYKHLLRDDPALAATCNALPELQKLKGFGAAVKVYEVPWRKAGEPFDEEFASRIFGDTTNFIKRENL